MPSLKPIGGAVAATLQNAREAGRFPHCILLTGGSETARLDTAFYIAAMLECTGERPPCGTCRDCRKVAEDVHPDVTVIRAGGKSATVRLEDVRAIREMSALPPGEGKVRAFLVPEADRLRTEGQNALLKIAEEPPERVYLIFCADGRASLLPTMLSRLYHIDLGAAQADPSAKTRQKAAQACEEIADALRARDEYRLAVILKAAKDRAALSLIAQQLRLVLRDALMRGADGLSGRPETAERLAEAFPPDRLSAMIDAAGYAVAAAERNANLNLMQTVLSAKLAEAWTAGSEK